MTGVQSAKPVAQLVAEQVPPPHDSLEFGMSQIWPQAPQFDVVQIDVSQPFCALLSQLSQPALQLGKQPLAEQVVVPCALLQASPQPRQFDNVPSAVSQPAADVQSAKPVLHVDSTHVPVLHDSVAFGRSQRTPQSPQLDDVRMLVSQPFEVLPSQLLKPASHTGVHPLLPQLVVPWLLLQASPQLVQLVVVPSCVSQPGALVQSAQPVSQLVSLQLPVLQDSLACGKSQVAPQPPQLAAVFKRDSQPLFLLVSSSQLP